MSIQTPTSFSAVRAAIDAQRDETLADLLRLIAQPSISAQNIGVKECAALEMDLLRKAG
ncbi:MAG: peptidase M20, partial [Chloroflexia bacterium]|nr:peptidase M20 [Chloroflexia bacterium]